MSSRPWGPISSGLGTTLHGEPAARHAERLHEGGDLPRRALPRRRLRACGQAVRGRLVSRRAAPSTLLDGSARLGLGVGRAVQFPLACASSCAGSSVSAHAMLARQGLERRRLALDLLLARRIDVERLEITAQRVGGLPGEDRGFADQIRRLLRAAGSAVGGAAQRARGLGEQIVRARLLVARTRRRAPSAPRRPAGRGPKCASAPRTAPRWPRPW